MGERRQVHRREPIEVVFDDGKTYLARPLPWTARNDLGDEILQQNLEAVNEAVKIFVTDVDGTQVPQLSGVMKNKITDWSSVLRKAFPDIEVIEFSSYTNEELAELTIASLEVNGLEHLRDLVDPNSPTPMLPGGTSFSAEGMTQIPGQKIESSELSSSEDSAENPSSN